MFPRVLFVTLGLLAIACRSENQEERADDDGSGGLSSASGGAGESAGGGGAGGEEDKAALCTDNFGSSLTDSYARLDGTVLAVVAPTDTQCPLVNDDHLVIEVVMNDEAYRMVVNIDGVGYAELEAPLVGIPFEEGWHTNVTLEYPTDLDVHSPAFDFHSMEEVIALVSAHIEIGAPISIYGVSSGGELASSAHLIHYNNSQPDGAIAIDPTAATSRYLLFRFDNQQF